MSENKKRCHEYDFVIHTSDDIVRKDIAVAACLWVYRLRVCI